MNVPSHRKEDAARNLRKTRQLQNKLRESGLPVIECLECGKVFRSLHVHLRWKHKEITLRDYRIKHALPLGFKAVTPDLLETFRDRLVNDASRMASIKAYLSSPKHEADVAKRVADPMWREKIGEMQRVCMDEEEREKRRKRIGEQYEASRIGQRIKNIEKGRTLIKTCPQCGGEFKTKRSDNHKYCNSKCYQPNRAAALKCSQPIRSAALVARHAAKRAELLSRRQAVCIGCGCDFARNRKSSVYCTSECCNRQTVYPISRTNAQLEQAWEAAKAGIFESSSPYDHFVALCCELQGHWPGEPIALPLESIATILSCNFGTVGRYRQRAVDEGKLVCVTPYVAHRTAASYRVVSA